MAWLLLSAALVAGGAPPAARAQVHEVRLLIQPVPGQPIPEFYFEPVGLYIQPGDTVVFKALSPHHTVTAYHPRQGKPQRVPDGVEPFSSPVLPVGGEWRYTFTVPGVYDIWCAPHEMYGMVMRIVVGSPAGPGTTPSKDFGPEGTFGVAGQVLNHPLLDPARIVAQGSVSWSALPAEVKVMRQGPPGAPAQGH
ncbi:MAG: hypothetical protein HPY83_19515 [Anaerolineae bacterium]|nr:hypothetical protein [Anaerolineae bacterium]